MLFLISIFCLFIGATIRKFRHFLITKFENITAVVTKAKFVKNNNHFLHLLGMDVRKYITFIIQGQKLYYIVLLCKCNKFAISLY
jgi:hypothetical protein